jgi:hypothetical protein
MELKDIMGAGWKLEFRKRILPFQNSFNNVIVRIKSQNLANYKFSL